MWAAECRGRGSGARRGPEAIAAIGGVGFGEPTSRGMWAVSWAARCSPTVRSLIAKRLNITALLRLR